MLQTTTVYPWKFLASSYFAVLGLINIISSSQIERPATPVDAKIFRCTHDAVEIGWTRDDKAKEYIINVYPSNGNNYVMAEVGNHFVQNGLRSNQVYEFTVEASNDFAVSKISTVLKCKTLRMGRHYFRKYKTT